MANVYTANGVIDLDTADTSTNIVTAAECTRLHIHTIICSIANAAAPWAIDLVRASGVPVFMFRGPDPASARTFLFHFPTPLTVRELYQAANFPTGDHVQILHGGA